MLSQKEKTMILENFAEENQPIEIINKLNDGQSEAAVYTVEFSESRKLGVLKIQEMNESGLHNKAFLQAIENGIEGYIPEIIDEVEIQCENNLKRFGVLYELGGDNVLGIKTLKYSMENELALVKQTSEQVAKFLYNWNKPHISEIKSPIDIMKTSLGYRFMDEKFIKGFETLMIDEDKKWLVIDGVDKFFPNPYKFFADEKVWCGRKIKYLDSCIHGDLHGGNIIVSVKKPSIIDFGSYQLHSNIFYDTRYLEIHSLMDYLKFDNNKQRKFWISLCDELTKNVKYVDIPDGEGASILRDIIPELRHGIDYLLSDSRNKLYEPSFYLAGVSAGLNFIRKTKDENKRMAAMIYTMYNLRAVLKHELIDLYNPSLLSSTSVQWFLDEASISEYLDNDSIYKIDEKAYHISGIIKNKSIELTVEPIINLNSGRVKSLEILVRDSRLEFFPDEMFEKARLTGDLENLTMLACDKLNNYLNKLEPFIEEGLFFKLQSDTTRHTIKKVIKKLEGTNLVLEITQRIPRSAFWRNFADELKFKLAMDNFGEGNSNMVELIKMKPHFIKISQEIVKDVHKDEIKALMIEHMVKMGIKTGMKIIAEGIRTLEEKEKLMELGVEYGQGTYFSSAMLIDHADYGIWKQGF
ncbi:EAL domain-containing protein [Clostridium sp. CM028]|uniref:EAL domain-containing protein n=1 Tax=unclassified Clostridium TaxID=2614128 RepID=UPI001C0C56B0|nr:MULTISPECIES: EAL domain-containing protein [unclassified Clostridium]MBU3092491.1 EAL domain-containing protein [Clostridium sp. CF011]MBW9146392.1 EAL domain-containing protein [Clostridium sp. CM027]MBW9150007.1 EAL domain-containing protein [Clostridium sp. CM028]UVE39902.1 EAL domain-containing protein [Clostridium sp. CM027]WAG68818.1 EAL domain-containing protein [Clostridium sp. CF011]